MTKKVVYINLTTYIVGQVFNWPDTWRQDFFENSVPTEYYELNESQLMVDLGWSYEGGDFYPPPDTSPTFGRIITKLAWRMRFTHPERVAIKMASLGLNLLITNEQRAALASSEDDVMAAGYINLDDPATVAGADFVESLGLIASGRADEVVGPPVYSAEVPAEIRITMGLPALPTEIELAENDGRGFTTLGQWLNAHED